MIPTAGKLDPRWEGGWTIKSVLSPTTYTISDGGRIKTVHINCLQPRVQAVDSFTPNQQLHWRNWEPPQIEHDVVDSEPRYPPRTRRPPTRYQAQLKDELITERDKCNICDLTLTDRPCMHIQIM